MILTKGALLAAAEARNMAGANLLSVAGEILLPALIMAGIALILGAAIALCSVKFAVTKEEKVERVEELLAGSNCGGCGRATRSRTKSGCFWGTRRRMCAGSSGWARGAPNASAHGACTATPKRRSGSLEYRLGHRCGTRRGRRRRRRRGRQQGKRHQPRYCPAARRAAHSSRRRNAHDAHR